MKCEHCGLQLPAPVGRGRPRKFCSNAHREAAYMARRLETVREEGRREEGRRIHQQTIELFRHIVQRHHIPYKRIPAMASLLGLERMHDKLHQQHPGSRHAIEDWSP